MQTLTVRPDDDLSLDFHGAKAIADAAAEAVQGESLCMSWYDRARDRESPAHASDCHGDCDVPGYEEYAIHRGAQFRVVFGDRDYVFCYRGIGEFAGL